VRHASKLVTMRFDELSVQLADGRSSDDDSLHRPMDNTLLIRACMLERSVVPENGVAITPAVLVHRRGPVEVLEQFT
jgi:hypothetical protein